MQISWWTLLIQAVNFLVLVWLLQRFLYKPVQDVIEKRSQARLAATADVEKAKAEAEASKERYGKAMAAIEEERNKVLNKAREDIKIEREQMKEEALSSSSKMIDEAKKTINEERTAATEQLKSETVELAVQLAKTLLNDMAKAIPNDAMLDHLEERLASLPSGERRRLNTEIEANGAQVEIITARPLTGKEHTTWKLRIEKILNQSIEPKFISDPQIISGAVLRLPHTVIRATWADQLASAQAVLKRGSDG